MNLQAFMAQNAEKVEAQKKVVSERFKDNEGNPVEWQFAPITGDEDDRIRKSCTKKVQHPAKKGVIIPETDHALYMTKLTVASVKYPDLHNAELQDSYKVKSAEELLSIMLLPGELADAKQFAQEVNGFDIDFDDLVDEAKN